MHDTDVPFVLYSKNDNPPLGIQVVSLNPGEKYKIRVKDVKVVNAGQCMVEASFGIPLLENTNVIIDILRDNRSIIGGPQNFTSLERFNDISGAPPVAGRFTTTIVTVDKDVPVGTHKYKIILMNDPTSADIVQLSRYSVGVKALIGAVVTATQDYPAMAAPAALVILPAFGISGVPNPTNFVDIKLHGTRHKHGKVRLNTSLDVNVNGLHAQLNFNILRADGTSLTNGIQTYANLLGPFTDNEVANINLNFTVCDDKPSKKYTLRLINASIDNTEIDIDYYSFNCEYYAPRIADQLAYLDTGRNNIPAISDPAAYVLLANQNQTFMVPSISTGPTKITLTTSMIIGQVYTDNILINVRRGMKMCDSSSSSSSDASLDYMGTVSLTNGVQELFKLNNAGMTIEINVEYIAIDVNPPAGEKIYYVDIINTGAFTVQIDFVTMTVE